MARHLEIYTEEQSAEVFLNILLPRLFPNISFKIYPHQGKSDLLKKLPKKLYAARQWMTDDYRIIVLLDRDKEDCEALKLRLENLAHTAGFVTKTQNAAGFQVVNRIAIEELEAWMLGDETAVRAAFPCVPTFIHKEEYQNPDDIINAWETLENLLQRGGYYKKGYPKKDAARKIAANMNPEVNKSRSFHVFIEGVKACLAG